MSAPSDGRRAMDPGLRRRIWWRCLGLQATWNNQRMQNLGLLAAFSPWTRWRGLDADARRALARRYLGFFNTNPYLASFVVGGLLRLENDRQDGHAPADAMVAGFRDSLSRACGAIGDELFWLGLRPAYLVLALVLAWLVAWPLALATVAIFALGQLYLRWRGLAAAFRLGPGVVGVLSRPVWHRAVAWSRRLALGLTGFLVGCFFARGSADGLPAASGPLVVLVAVGLGIPCLLRQRHAGETLFLLAAVAVAGSALLF